MLEDTYPNPKLAEVTLQSCDSARYDVRCIGLVNLIRQRLVPLVASLTLAETNQPRRNSLKGVEIALINCRSCTLNHIRKLGKGSKMHGKLQLQVETQAVAKLIFRLTLVLVPLKDHLSLVVLTGFQLR
jgi:AMMECR1 domain-containing protein